jgi:hypothetical protein
MWVNAKGIASNHLFAHEMNKSRKLLLEPGQTRLSSFIGTNGSQGRHQASMREPLLQTSDIWLVKELEPRQSKGLRQWIQDLIDEK